MVLLAVGFGTFAGCSSVRHDGTPAASSSSPPGAPGSAASPGSVGVSPGGVTTRVDAPADSSEEEYGQACRAAKMWMNQHGGDSRTLFEPYLATLQAPGAVPGAATFNTPWAQLTPPRQAAVIVAVRAAADGQCG